LKYLLKYLYKIEIKVKIIKYIFIFLQQIPFAHNSPSLISTSFDTSSYNDPYF